MERTPLPQPFLVNFILAGYAIVSVEQCLFAAVLMCVDSEEDKFINTSSDVDDTVKVSRVTPRFTCFIHICLVPFNFIFVMTYSPLLDHGVGWD